MAIDVGPPCQIDNSTDPFTNFTVVNRVNPANAKGTIDYVCVYTATANLAGLIEAAGFHDEGANVLHTDINSDKGVEFADLPDGGGAGKTEYNAPGDFTAFDINSGEYIGLHIGTGGSGDVYRSDAGETGNWTDAGDQVPCASVEFDGPYTRNYSIYATGTEAGGGLSIPIAMHHYKQIAGAQ